MRQQKLIVPQPTYTSESDYDSRQVTFMHADKATINVRCWNRNAGAASSLVAEDVWERDGLRYGGMMFAHS